MINNKGTASVFLIFLFVILLGAVGVLLEFARYQGLQSYSEEVTDMAAESVMTQYYRPLYDDYHLFFMAFEDGSQVVPYVEGQTKEFLSYSIAPLGDLEGEAKGQWLAPLIMPSLQLCEVDELIWATDCEGKYFQEEAIAYMKNQSLDKLFHKLKSLLGKVESFQEETKVMEKKMECEAVITESAIQIVQLIKLIDGVSFSERRGKVTVSCESQFIKQFVPGELTMNNMGIGNSNMWTKIKSRCTNVNRLLDDIQRKCNSVLELEEERRVLVDEISQLSEEEKELQLQKEAEIESINSSIESIKIEIKSKCERFSELVNSTEQKVEQAMDEVEKLQLQSEKTNEVINEYKSDLINKKGEIDGELYNSLYEDVREMEEAAGCGINLEQVSQQLNSNLNILKNLHGLDMIASRGGMSNISSICSAASDYQVSLKKYSINSIQFNYGTYGEEESNNPISALKELVSEGILALVVPDEMELSEQSITTDHILYEAQNDEISLGIQKLIVSLEDTKEMGSLFHLFDGNLDISELADNVYLHFYEQDHFKDLMGCESTHNTSLCYEKEYIINGELKDEENLKETIDKMMTWRTVFHFISVMSDSEKRGVAKKTAQAIAGVTGIPPLVYVTQTLILLTWAVEEALVDIAAILQKKEVDIFKRGKDFSIEFADLLTLNREKIQYKASQLEKGNEGLSYESFLEILMFLSDNQEKSYRCMNLINANMILHHNKNFSLRNCVYGFQLKLRLNANNVFSSLQSGGMSASDDRNGWHFNCVVSKSY